MTKSINYVLFKDLRTSAVADIEVFCNQHVLTEWEFGTKFAHDHKFVGILRAGGRGGSVGLTRLEQVAHRANEWAEGRPIPAGGIRGFGGVVVPAKLAA